MTMTACPTGVQDSNWCPKTTDDVLPSVLALLPLGPAWSASSVEGTVQNGYWRTLANVLGFAYGRLCAFYDECFCSTVSESLDQWAKDYGLDDPCDPYGGNLCAKVASQGGAKCEDFVAAAEAIGWVVTCTDLSQEPEPIAGCFEVGCTMLGETPVFNPLGTALGLSELYPCNYGQVVNHPDPDKWENGKQFGASCPVPGSNLGFGPDENESCCFIVGYYDTTPVSVAVETTYCQGYSDTILFDCPSSYPENAELPKPADYGWYDKNNNYTQWGNAFTWRLTVDVAASRALQAGNAPVVVEPNTYSAAGQFMAGNIPFEDAGGQVGGSPLCSPNNAASAFAICALERIAPAHTQLTYEVIQP